MTIELAVIGKTTQDFTLEGIQMYTKRINRYVKFSVFELKGPKATAKTPPEQLIEKEGEVLINHIKKSPAYTVLLDERGKRFSSKKFASFVQKQLTGGIHRLVFVVGGAYGFSAAVKQEANLLLSLSDMTFSHQIIRLFFAEQLYRAFTIIRNEPYHNE